MFLNTFPWRNRVGKPISSLPPHTFLVFSVLSQEIQTSRNNFYRQNRGERGKPLRQSHTALFIKAKEKSPVLTKEHKW